MVFWLIFAFYCVFCMNFTAEIVEFNGVKGKLVSTGKPGLGISTKARDDLKVVQILPKGTADAIGIKIGDVIKAISVKGEKIHEWKEVGTVQEVLQVYADMTVGGQVQVRVSRNGEILTMKGKILDYKFERLQSLPEKGLKGFPAPAWKCSDWFQAGELTPELSSFEGKFVVLFFFQHWCPGCHARGFPIMQQLAKKYKGDESVKLLAIQTVFEGGHTNTFENGKKDMVKYGLKIPFGQDAKENRRTYTMQRYRTGGTPWLVLIGPDGVILHDGFDLPGKKLLRKIQFVDKLFSTLR